MNDDNNQRAELASADETLFAVILAFICGREHRAIEDGLGLLKTDAVLSAVFSSSHSNCGDIDSFPP